MGKVFISLKELEGKTCKWIDARYALGDPAFGKNAYHQAHVEGAVHWDLGEDLSNVQEGGGRHPLPSQTELVDLFERSGLQVDDLIVVYDTGGSPFATRAWWILHYAGFTNAFVLLEGFNEIKAAGIPTTKKQPTIERTSVTPNWQEEIHLKRDDVEEIVAGKRPSTLVDARANARYRGEHEPLDRVAGHIPSALNFDWEQLKEDGVYQATDKVQEKLAHLANKTEELTVYCGSGVTATPIFAMLTHLGHKNVRLYAGSYSDWVSKEDAPVETGENEG